MISSRALAAASAALVSGALVLTGCATTPPGSSSCGYRLSTTGSCFPTEALCQVAGERQQERDYKPYTCSQR